jgi:DNA-binding XRE family transcriptional regulator
VGGVGRNGARATALRHIRKRLEIVGAVAYVCAAALREQAAGIDTEVALSLQRCVGVEQGLTQEAFAIAAGLPDAATATKMERGEREPTLTELFRIASALRSSPAILSLPEFIG